MVDFSNYLAPGVYVEEEISDFVAVVGIQPSSVAIIGPGNQNTVVSDSFEAADGENGIAIAETFELDDLVIYDESGNPNLGVDESSIVVRLSASGANLVLDTDYSIDVGAFEDPDEGVVTITALENGDLIGEASLFVTYNFTPGDFFDPKTFTDFDDVQDSYGVAFDSGGTLVSPITLAARIAFLNGARRLVLVATGDGEASALISGMSALAADSTIDLVVPLPVDVDSNGIAAVVAGVDSFVSDTDNRLVMAVLGTEPDDNGANLAETENARIILPWPNSLRYFNGPQNEVVDVAGYYLAAAYAGRLSGLAVQTPLTKKQILGFVGVPISVAQLMTPTNLNTLTQGGFAVTELTRDNRLQVRHGVTSMGQGSNIQDREISLIRAKDRLMTMIHETVEGTGLIGTWIDSDTPGRVKGVVGGVLETALLSDIIVGYDNLKARQLNLDPSVIQVKFRYQPAYPLNYILVSFSINTETGDFVTETLEDTNA